MRMQAIKGSASSQQPNLANTVSREFYQNTLKKIEIFVFTAEKPKQKK